MFYSQNHHKLFFITSAIRQSFNPIDSVELWKRAKLHIWINSALNSKYIDDEKQSIDIIQNVQNVNKNL